MRLRVGELEHLTELAEAVAAARDDRGARARGRPPQPELLGRDSVRLYLLDADEERLRLRWSDPPATDAPATIGLGELGPELGRSRRAPRLTVSLIAGDELLGALIAERTTELDLARAVANQAAVALKKIQVLERLAEKNLIKDFFEDLAARRLGAALEGRSARLGCDLNGRTSCSPPSPCGRRARARLLARSARGSLLDRREQALRALVPVPVAGR